MVEGGACEVALSGMLCAVDVMVKDRRCLLRTMLASGYDFCVQEKTKCRRYGVRSGTGMDKESKKVVCATVVIAEVEASHEMKIEGRQEARSRSHVRLQKIDGLHRSRSASCGRPDRLPPKRREWVLLQTQKT